MSLPILYHGTSSFYLDTIMTKGLDPLTSCYHHVCLTSDLKIATSFGTDRARWEKAKLIIFRIDPAHLDHDGFTHEMGWIGNSLWPDEANACLAGTWQEMLLRHMVTGYRKIIPPGCLATEDLHSH